MMLQLYVTVVRWFKAVGREVALSMGSMRPGTQREATMRPKVVSDNDWFTTNLHVQTKKTGKALQDNNDMSI